MLETLSFKSRIKLLFNGGNLFEIDECVKELDIRRQDTENLILVIADHKDSIIKKNAKIALLTEDLAELELEKIRLSKSNEACRSELVNIKNDMTKVGLYVQDLEADVSKYKKHIQKLQYDMLSKASEITKLREKVDGVITLGKMDNYDTEMSKLNKIIGGKRFASVKKIFALLVETKDKKIKDLEDKLNSIDVVVKKERNVNTKTLDCNKIKDLKHMLDTGSSRKDVMDKYNISNSTITRILNCKTYKECCEDKKE